MYMFIPYTTAGTGHSMFILYTTVGTGHSMFVGKVITSRRTWDRPATTKLVLSSVYLIFVHAFLCSIYWSQFLSYFDNIFLRQHILTQERTVLKVQFICSF